MIPIRVLKIGGSLFQHDWLTTALGHWVAQEGSFLNVAVTGGGCWANKIRQLESSGQLTKEEAHWSAVRMMSWSSIWLASKMTEASHISLIRDLRMLNSDQTDSNLVFFDPFLWLRHGEPFQLGPKLPIGWQTTSDSIAARLAQTLGADLVVFKSVRFEFASITDAVQAGFVDDFFGEIVSNESSVRFIDFPQWHRDFNILCNR